MTKDLSGLSREEKLKYIELLEEKRRRRKAFKIAYNPNEGQIAVHKSEARIRAVFSGNGSGKTALAVNELIWACIGYNPILKKQTSVPIKAVVLIDDPQKVDEQWIPEINKWFDTTEWDFAKSGKPYISLITLPNGSQIRFMFHLMESLKFEGIEVDFVVCDEPPPRHAYIGLSRGGRRKNREPRFLFCGTPIGGDAAWMRRELFDPWTRGERPDIECFKFGTKVNEKNLSDNYIDDFSRNLTEKEKRIRLEGDFFDLDGLALAHLFRRETHVIPRSELPEISVATVAIDPHPNKKHVAAIVGADRWGNLYYIKEIALKMVPREFAKQLKTWYEGYRIVDIICDSLGSAQMTGGEGFKSFIEVLKEEGIPVRATSFQDKDDESWMMRIQDCLSIPVEPDNFGQKLPKLRIIEGNAGIIGDIETVSFIKIKNEDNYKPKLDITQKDFLAVLKYALSTNITPSNKKSKAYRVVDRPSTYGIKSPKGRIGYNNRYRPRSKDQEEDW